MPVARASSSVEVIVDELAGQVVAGGDDPTLGHRPARQALAHAQPRRWTEARCSSVSPAS